MRMKVAVGRVVNGTVVTKEKLPEGARVAIVLEDDEPEFDLDAADEAAIAVAVKELDAGEAKPVSELKRKLEQHR